MITRQQLDWLTAKWGVNQSEALTLIIDRGYREERKMTAINLIEDNAGGLFIGTDNGPWYDMTQVQSDSTFGADAAALLAGETSDWTVDRYDEEPIGELVGEWVDGALRIVMQPDGYTKAGIAARIYMGLPARE